MSNKKYVIRGNCFGYNDECFYVEGNRIKSTFTDKEEAEAAYRQLEVEAARRFDLSEVESIFEAEDKFLKGLDKFVFDETGTHILEGDYVDRGTYLPKELSDESVLKFVEMAAMDSYQLIVFDDDKQFFALWLPEEKAYATIPSEDMDYLIYEADKKDLQSEIEELIDYNEWNPTVIKGALDEISHSPLLLEQMIKREKKLSYDEKSKQLKISGKKASTYMVANQFLVKPLFEIREVTIDEVREIEDKIYKEFCGQYEDDDYEEGADEVDAGPELDVEDLIPLRKACITILEAKSPKVKDYIYGLKAICHELVLLESGFEIHEENGDEFVELYETHTAYLEGEHLHDYFCAFYRSVVATVSEGKALGELIQSFDEATYFSGSLINLFSLEKDEVDVFTESIASQDDFDAWKDYIVLLATIEEDEVEEAA